MASRIPILRNTNIAYFIPQAAILLLFYFLLKSFHISSYILIGTALYLLISMYLKIIVPRWHRKGVFYVKKGELQGAVFSFEKSYLFFQKYAWIDKFRTFTLLSTSRFSYSEMALINLIFCYEQMGDKAMAAKYRKKLKHEFPNNKYVQN